MGVFVAEQLSVWYLDVTVSYKDQTTKSLSAIKDGTAIRYLNSTGLAADWADAKTSQELQLLLTKLGYGPIVHKNLAATVKQITFRFGAITEEGQLVQVIGSSDALANLVVADNVTQSLAELNSDSDFVTFFNMLKAA